MFQLIMQQWVRCSGWPLSLTMGLKNKIFNFHFHTRPLISCRSVMKYLCPNTALIKVLNFRTWEFVSSRPLKQSDWHKKNVVIIPHGAGKIFFSGPRSLPNIPPETAGQGRKIRAGAEVLKKIFRPKCGMIFTNMAPTYYVLRIFVDVYFTF